MPTSLTVVTPPATEPISLAEARAHLRLDITSGTSTSDESLAPGTYAAGTYNGTGVSVAGYVATIICNTGSSLGANFAVYIDESPDNSTWTLWQQMSGVNSINISVPLVYTGVQPYIRARMAVGGTTTYMGVVVMLQPAPTDESSLINGLIKAARIYVETATKEALITQTLRYTRDVFPDWDIELPMCPLQSVSSVTYLDQSGATITVASTDYEVDSYSKPARVTPRYGTVWPIPRYVHNAVQVQYVAGYGASTDVPQTHKQAMLLLVGHWYENREAVSPAPPMMQVPMAVEALLAVSSHGEYR